MAEVGKNGIKKSGKGLKWQKEVEKRTKMAE